VRAIEAMTLGESDLSSRAFNRGTQELTNVAIIEEARGCP
jgi:hypothetical protein